MMLRADWPLGRWLALHPAGRLLTQPGLSAQSARSSRWSPTPPPTAPPHTHKHTHECALRPCAPPAAATCRLHLDENSEGGRREEYGGNRSTKQCVHIALCDATGYYDVCALLGCSGGAGSLHALTMDCLFLLIWTLPIPLVGCSSVRLLSTLLSWNIIKACGKRIYTLFKSPARAPVWTGTRTNTRLSLFRVICVRGAAAHARPRAASLKCGCKVRQVIPN